MKTRVCFLGDSITAGVGSTLRYSDEFGRITDAEIFNFGVSGASSLDLLGQIDRMEEKTGGVLDIICIFIGTNDFNCGVEIGEWFTEPREEEYPEGLDEKGEPTGYCKRLKREYRFDGNTFKGRLNRILSRLRNRYAEARIVLITPIHRGYAFFGGNNLQPEELYSNKKGIFFEEYVRTVREAADVWSVELIDLYRDSGLYPMADVNAKAFFHDAENDRLHPNAEGQKRIARILAKRLIG